MSEQGTVPHRPYPSYKHSGVGWLGQILRMII